MENDCRKITTFSHNLNIISFQKSTSSGILNVSQTAYRGLGLHKEAEKYDEVQSADFNVAHLESARVFLKELLRELLSSERERE